VDLVAQHVGDLARAIGTRLTNRQRYGFTHAVKLSTFGRRSWSADFHRNRVPAIAPVDAARNQLKPIGREPLRHLCPGAVFSDPDEQNLARRPGPLTFSAWFAQPTAAPKGNVLLGIC
jgi:hypothetical protein